MKPLPLTFRTMALLLGLTSAGPARTFVLNSTNDTHDVVPGDGVCADAGGYCTLRAGVEEAGTGDHDTVLFAGDSGPVFLTLGAIVVNGPFTVIMGSDSASVIDGRNNPVGTDNLELTARGGQLARCAVINSRRNGVRVIGDSCRVGIVGTLTIFAGNGAGEPTSAGILVAGPSVGTSITAMWVGLNGNGTRVDPNRHGIRLVGTRDVTISGAVENPALISGNSGHGIWIDSGSVGTRITGAYIGMDATGLFAAPNGGDGIRITGGSSKNRIGGLEDSLRNIISGNTGCGIRIDGDRTDSNVIGGNFVGLDSSGWISIGNHAAGVRVAEGARWNEIGYDSAGAGNHLVVSGNYGNGVELVGVGTDSNRIDWSYIGLDGTGNGDRPNGLGVGQGVYIGSGARGNIVGRESGSVRNVISGNYGPGICIAGSGTDGNVVVGNYIGVSRFGTSPEGNSAGVVIRDSARFNEIGTVTRGNLISGNRGDLFPLGAGVVIWGSMTTNNFVRNNYIGCDYTGTRAIRNGSAGIILGSGANHNVVGGDSAVGNLISGNGTLPLTESMGAGIHLFGQGTDSNVIAGNRIGVAADGRTSLANNGHGIGIFGGAKNTLIGGSLREQSNTISRNRWAGVWIDGSLAYGHEIRINSIFDNDSSGITLSDGANAEAPQVHVMSATPLMITGTCSDIGATVDLYKAKTSAAGRVQGMTYVGIATVDADSTFGCVVSGVVTGDTITAVGTAPGAGSSAFSVGLPVAVPTEIDIEETGPPGGLVLYQNAPNPFNPTTTISFDLPGPQNITLDIVNVLGNRVLRLVSGPRPAGHYSIEWDGKGFDGRAVASGAYFYRLSTPIQTLTKKMLLLK
jgi:hypothetical protein